MNNKADHEQKNNLDVFVTCDTLILLYTITWPGLRGITFLTLSKYYEELYMRFSHTLTPSQRVFLHTSELYNNPTQDLNSRLLGKSLSFYPPQHLLQML